VRLCFQAHLGRVGSDLCDPKSLWEAKADSQGRMATHASSALVPESVTTKTEFYVHAREQLCHLLETQDGRVNWVRPAFADRDKILIAADAVRWPVGDRSLLHLTARHSSITRTSPTPLPLDRVLAIWSTGSVRLRLCDMYQITTWDANVKSMQQASTWPVDSSIVARRRRARRRIICCWDPSMGGQHVSSYRCPPPQDGPWGSVPKHSWNDRRK
jgi:hypothetical protein